jgi:light-regulated signal transduction histidine kinase (bacteriophytochrome)
LENEITVRKSVEAELRQSSLELETANKEMEAFTYSVSHDLKSPLRNIEGFSSLLLMRYSAVLDAKGKEYLQYVSESTHLMEKLLEDILGLYRITHAELHVKNVDMSQLAYDVKEELERTDPERKVAFEIMPGMVADGDELLLKLVLQNLIGNAFKFTGKKMNARIEVGTKKIAGVKTLFIRDNGAGFDMEFANKLFKPFQRLHTPAEFPGTGIGLASVQRIIERHGGKVWAEAELDKGATFYFTLPGM